MRILLYILISAFFTAAAGWAKNPSRLAVREPVFDGIENATFYTKQTLKLSQKMIWEHGGFHPVFTESAEKAFYNLDMRIFKQDDMRALKFEIKDPQGRVVKEAWAFGIQKRFLLLQIRLSFYEMLHGKARLKKLLARAQKEKEQEAQEPAGPESADTNQEDGASSNSSDKDRPSGELRSLLDALIENKTFAIATSLETAGNLETAMSEFKLKKKALKN